MFCGKVIVVMLMCDSYVGLGVFGFVVLYVIFCEFGVMEEVCWWDFILDVWCGMYNVKYDFFVYVLLENKVEKMIGCIG